MKHARLFGVALTFAIVMAGAMVIGGADQAGPPASATPAGGPFDSLHFRPIGPASMSVSLARTLIVTGVAQLAANAQGAFDWKKFKGEKIEVFLVKSPRGDLLTKYHKEFEDLTGISVGSEMIPEQQQRHGRVAPVARLDHDPRHCHGGEAEGERLQRLAAALPPARFRVAQSLPLADLARLLAACQAFIGHDSGISHLAAVELLDKEGTPRANFVQGGLNQIAEAVPSQNR